MLNLKSTETGEETQSEFIKIDVAHIPRHVTPDTLFEFLNSPCLEGIRLTE